MPITQNTTLAQMIHDFVNSDDPKFKNDSVEQRKKRAIGAWYGLHKESIISFKDWLMVEEEDKKLDTTKNKGVVPLETQFGKHSIEKKKPEPLSTQFGKHSIEEDISSAKRLALHEHYSFSDKEAAHIKSYTESSITLNHRLHSRSGLGDQAALCSGMDQVTRKHKTPHDMTVYSGLRKSPENSVDEHGIAHHPAFLSTSISKKQADGFARPDSTSRFHGEAAPGHMLKLHVPAGSHGAYVDHHSANVGEREFIAPAGSKIKIHPKPTIDHRSNLVIWHGHLQPHEE